MKPLAELRDLRHLRGLLFDIDETLTTEGKLTAEAYTAMERLKRAGKLVVPITGRPAGWCDHIARMSPVDAVVGENGAFYFGFFDGKLLAGCALASDQIYRETDLAIDFREVVPALVEHLLKD